MFTWLKIKFLDLLETWFLDDEVENARCRAQIALALEQQPQMTLARTSPEYRCSCCYCPLGACMHDGCSVCGGKRNNEKVRKTL